MFYRGRHLRRLWEVEVYKGDPDDPNTKTSIESVIGWNATDAIRQLGKGRAATYPQEICYITWDDPPLRINDTAGPTDIEVKPSMRSIIADDQSSNAAADKKLRKKVAKKKKVVKRQKIKRTK